ncbi:extracellular solute-binding protein [Texas Phoenix palm phytoplasma]|uniref:Extracellular solute-binding protein n=1 Tax=Texas Phoenix palm phytoplasma TaxID=176709 RepID=A0ABS5BJG3_9MOLU|nr:extracellular solute-binding protein [Texas Phoenix palm phytoplasma]MBP3059501.1 extracellular solute-binding protein [Texas Phoenix palm phytoplasma]
MKKKILFFTISLFIIIIYIFISIILSKNKKEKQIISLFNWNEYIDPEIIDDYNKKSDKFNVKQSFFSSNELAINKIKAGNQYDIAILSEYAIEQLKNDYLLKIKKKDNLKFTPLFESVNEINQNKIFKEYSIPYFWGKLGLLYNKNKFSKEMIKSNWKKILNNPNYKISLYNNAFEGIFLGLKATNGDISGINEKDIEKAKNWLIKLKKQNNNLFFITDQLLDNMKIKDRERYDISLTYSGDARYLIEQNNNLQFYDFSDDNEVKKGTNVWIDGLVLPKGSNEEAAYDFINFLLNKENIKKNALFVGYDSPYLERKDKTINLKVDKQNDKIYQYNEKTKIQISNYWSEVCCFPNPEDKYLFFLSFIILLIFIVLRFFHSIEIKNKKLILKDE